MTTDMAGASLDREEEEQRPEAAVFLQEIKVISFQLISLGCVFSFLKKKKKKKERERKKIPRRPKKTHLQAVFGNWAITV